MSDDRGSASIWVLACALVVLAFGYAVTLRGLAVLTRHRADAAADLSALAGAGRIGVGVDPCEAAAAVAAANRASLVSCRVALEPGGRDGTIAVTVRLRTTMPMVGVTYAQSSARAGRLPAG